MGNTSRFVVTAQGKGGETYYTHFKDKQGLEKWIAKHQDKIFMNQLKIIDNGKHPLLKWFALKM